MTSYKTLYQEEQKKTADLQEEVAKLKIALSLSPDAAIREIERTREITDLAGIATHMRVERFTPQQWKQRGHLPPVDFPDIAEPLWYVSTIKEKFVVPTRRVWYDDVPDEELSPAA